MADEEETLQQKHKREQKELQAKIQNLKHSVPKGDKKKKRQIAIDVAKLEAELDEKQSRELKEAETTTTGHSQIIDGVSSIAVTDEDVENTGDQPKKISKAQKRREKKEAEEKARQQRLEEGEKEALHHSRNVEAKLFDELLTKKGLKIVEVTPDGNCLYKSVIMQLGDSSESRLSQLREQTSTYMMQHMHDFLPFTSNIQTGEMFTPDEYEKYCSDIKGTNSWGGQLELRAISQVLQHPIEVYQASTPIVHIGEELERQPLRLSYHRHQYGLGEHYNAVFPDT